MNLLRIRSCLKPATPSWAIAVIGLLLLAPALYYSRALADKARLIELRQTLQVVPYFITFLGCIAACVQIFTVDFHTGSFSSELAQPVYRSTLLNEKLAAAAMALASVLFIETIISRVAAGLHMPDISLINYLHTTTVTLALLILAVVPLASILFLKSFVTLLVSGISIAALLFVRHIIVWNDYYASPSRPLDAFTFSLCTVFFIFCYCISLIGLNSLEVSA